MPLEKFFSKLRNTNYIYVILIIGAAVMLFASMYDGKGKAELQNSKTAAALPSEEERLENILSQIEGVGSVSVMITYYESMEKELAYETKKDRRADNANGSGGESSDEKAVMSGGAPVILKEVYPEVKGVIVIAEGADRGIVNQKICEAVSTSLGIAMHKICVLQKSKK